MTPAGDPPVDRRVLRRRVFRRAGAALAGGIVAGALAALLVAPLAGLLCLAVGLALAARFLHNPGGVPILVYHSVSPDARWLPWARNTSVRPEVLDIHLRTLRRDGWTIVPTEDLIAARTAGAPLPPRAVVLQFDDAYLDNYLFAVPILRDHAAPATIFVSVDFVAPGDIARDGADRCGPSAWQGYMNAAELRALDADPLFAIEAHGTDHARIPVSARSIGPVGRDWKVHAPLLWAAEQGDKSGWYRAPAPPPALAPGAPLPETDSALAGRWWRDDGPETDQAFRIRVAAMLGRAHRDLGAILGRPPRIMAWPFDRSDPLSVAAAHEAGFLAVTGGRGENRADDVRPGDRPVILSRVHLQDRAFGGGPLWLEALALRARVNTAAGRLAWHIPAALATLIRRWRLGPSGTPGAAS